MRLVFLINLDLLLLHTALFDRSTSLPLSLRNPGLSFCNPFHFKQYNKFFFINKLKLFKTIRIWTQFSSILMLVWFVNFGRLMQNRISSSYHLFDQTYLCIVWSSTPRIFHCLFDYCFDFWCHFISLKYYSLKKQLTWITSESINALEVKAFMVFNLVLGNSTILSRFFLFFLIIDLYFLIPVVNPQIFNPTAALAIAIRIPTNKAKEKTETHPLIAQTKIRNC